MALQILNTTQIAGATVTTRNENRVFRWTTAVN